jgi:hypothetical protein
MKHKRIPIACALASLLFLVGMTLLAGAQPVLAQCGGQSGVRSSCITCHEIQAPIASKGEWHIVHAGLDLCINCHGGNASTLMKADAHASMTANPLEDIYTDCHGCHPDYVVRASRYAAAIGVTPGSCATPTPVAISAYRGEPPLGDLSGLTGPAAAVPTPQPLGLIGFGLAVGILLFFGVGWLVGHRA